MTAAQIRAEKIRGSVSSADLNPRPKEDPCESFQNRSERAYSGNPICSRSTANRGCDRSGSKNGHTLRLCAPADSP